MATLLQTARLMLAPLDTDDAVALFACRSEPTVARYQGWRPVNVEEAAAFIARQAEVTFGAADSWYQLALRQREDGRYLGDLGVHFPETLDDAVELGVSLSPGAQGHGYAREAMTAMLEHVFAMGYRRVIGSVDPRNLASVALLRRLSFRQEAHHVQSLYLHGEWVDDLVFAMLADEWPHEGAAASPR